VINIHKWTCTKCDTKLFLRVDDSLIQDRGKLTKYEAHITKHVLRTEHEVIHKQKEEFKIKFV